MANLGPLQQNLTYGNLLQVDGGLTGDLKPVLDGDGNASGLSLSFTAAAISGLVTDIASNLYGGAPGSIPYQSSENDTNFVPAGAAGTVLASTGGGAPSWVNTIQYAVNSNIANKLNGGTVGQIPYQTSASNTGFLPVGTAGQVLVSNGAAAPSWTTSVASALAATAAANVAGGSSGNLLYQSATGLTDYVTNGTTGQILKSQGASAPLWSTLTASDVSAVPIDGSLAMTGNLSMGGHTITNLLNPLASTDAATKAYVDSVATGLKIKAACRVASTTNLVLSGLIAVDGVTVSSGDRVLIKDQSFPDLNGIYVASATAWTRSTDADTWDELVGATCFISAGSTQANTTWACNITAGGTIGVTPVTFVLFGASTSYTAGTGLTLIGSQFALATPVSVNNGGSGVTTLTGIIKGNGASAFTAATGADVVSLIGTTAVQNATTSTACSGNAATATKLQTPTSINGVSFDGSAASYTITASSPASLTVTNNGFGDTSPFLFDGSTAKTISWNSIGTVSNSSAGLTNPSAWRTNLGASTIGENLFTLTNPGAVTFPRFNADNTVSVLGAEAAINALLPSQTGNSGKVLTTNGTSAEWGTASSYNPAAVAITGGTINGVSLGATTAITSLTTSGAVNFSSYITVDPLVAAYFTNPRIWDSSQTHWYRITPSELADNRYITLPILNANDTFVFNNNTATLTNKTISGANNAFSNIGNASLTNSSITINGTSVSLGGSITVSGVGTVTSVDLTTPTGLTVSGGPITSSGTLAIALQSGYSIPTTTSQTNWDTAFNDRYRWDGGSTGVVPVTGRTSLQLGTTDTPQFAGLILSNKIRLSSTDYAWSSSISSLDVKNGSFYGFDNGSGTTTVGVARNLYVNSSNQWTYKNNGYGAVYFQSNTGDHSFYVTGTSGTAGTAATLNTALNVLANRNVECKANLDVTNAISINGSYGSTGQVLTSGGGGAMTWSTGSGSSGPFINVMDYGAVADNSTNNYTAFTNAINAAIAAKKPLFIPGGQYVIGSQIYVTTPVDIYSDMTAALRFTNTASCGFWFDFGGNPSPCSIRLPLLAGPGLNSSFQYPGYPTSWTGSSRYGTGLRLTGGYCHKVFVNWVNSWNIGVLYETANVSGVTAGNIDINIGNIDLCAYGVYLKSAVGTTGIAGMAIVANTIFAKYPIYCEATYNISDITMSCSSMFANETGGAVIYASGTELKNSTFYLNSVVAGYWGDSPVGTTNGVVVPYVSGDGTQNGESGFFRCGLNKISIQPSNTQPSWSGCTLIPVAGRAIRIKDAGTNNQISTVFDYVTTTPIALSSSASEASYNGGVGGAQYSKFVYSTYTLASSLAVGAGVGAYLFHQLAPSGSAINRPVKITDAAGTIVQNGIVAYAFVDTVTSTRNRQINVFFTNKGSATVAAGTTFYFWVEVD